MVNFYSGTVAHATGETLLIFKKKGNIYELKNGENEYKVSYIIKMINLHRKNRASELSSSPTLENFTVN